MEHPHRLLAPCLMLVLLLSSLSGCSVFQLLGVVPPDSPTGVTVGNATSSSLEILWDSPTGAKSYEVYRSSSDSGPWTEQVYNDSVAGFIDSGLPSGATFSYVVAAINAAGTSPLSDPASGTTTSGSGLPIPPVLHLMLHPPTAVAAPTFGTTTASSIDLSWGGVGDASATLTWGPVNTATSFNLYWTAGSTVTKETGTKVADVDLPLIVPGLDYGTEYGFILTAMNDLGESDASNVETVTPTLLSFQVFREDEAEDVTDASLQLYSGDGTSLTDSGLVSNWTYHYAVQATNSAGRTLSDDVSGTTDPVGGTTSDYHLLSGGSNRILSPDTLYAVQIDLGSGRVNGFGVHSCSSGPRIRMALYTDVSNSPGDLVAESIVTRMVNDSTNCNMEVLNAAPGNVAAGKYWVVVIVEDAATVWVDGAAAPVPFATKGLDFALPFPASFTGGTVTTDSPHGFYVVASFS